MCAGLKAQPSCTVGRSLRARQSRQLPICDSIDKTRRSSSSSGVPRLDRRLELLEIRVLELPAAAELFVVSFVETVETCGVEDLPEWLPVAKDPNERAFAGRAVNLERKSHEILRFASCLASESR